MTADVGDVVTLKIRGRGQCGWRPCRALIVGVERVAIGQHGKPLPDVKKFRMRLEGGETISRWQSGLMKPIDPMLTALLKEQKAFDPCQPTAL